ncbi:MAG: putative signal transduction protein [Candidatus Rifleibacterium amylolyticum]|nr:MAG: putative signal transduction protein [Candidatus Rifleibacterium amylolyticum]NLF96268.1 HDOD domain-containing protein [Candidatus Riflebacteria bacterium]
MIPRRLLFVDPDTNALDAYKRLLKALRPTWSASYAANGREAIQIMRKLKPDAMITELNMTIENDADLLKAVQKFYPDVIRIVLSSESDAQAETILRATQSAHRFLAKPCKGEVLLANIEQAAELRKILNSRELRELISGMPYLPSLPQLYNELISAMESPMVSVADLGEIIARDVSMTTRILHLVNSAFFGLPRQVSNPREAAVMLGMNVLKSLILYVKLFFAAPDSKFPGFSLDDMWAHSSITARLSREIARDFDGNSRVQEDAFLAGMLHDVGKLLLLEQPQYISNIKWQQSQNADLSFAEAEYLEYSTSHAEVGGYLLGLWGLPDPVVEAVACHHRPMQISGGTSPVLAATYLANALICRAGGEEIKFDETLLNQGKITKMLPSWSNQAKRLHEELNHS